MTAPAARGTDAEAELPSEPARPAARRDRSASRGRLPRLSRISGCARRLCAGLLVLVGLSAGLLAGGEAQAQSTDPVWSAILTVGNDSSAHGYRPDKVRDVPGALSSNMFQHQGSTVTVVRLLRLGFMYRQFQMGVTGVTDNTDYKLCFDGTSVGTGAFLKGSAHAVTSQALSADWTLGQKVAVALVGSSQDCPAPSLDASAITHNTATLTLTGHTGDWWFKQNSPTGGTQDNSCRMVAAGTSTADLTGLSPLAGHQYAAYSASGCAPANQLATESFSTLARPATAGVTAGTVTTSGATLTVTNHPATWYHKRTSPATGSPACSSGVTARTAALTSLDSGAAYTWKTYSDSSCSTELAEVDFTTSLHWTSTLTVGNDSGASSRGYYPSNAGSNPGILSPATISYGGATYTVDILRHSSTQGSDFQVSGTPAVATTFKLCFDGTAVGTKAWLNGTEQTFTNDNAADAAGWILDQTVKVALVESSASCPSGAGTKATPGLDVKAGTLTPTAATITISNHPLIFGDQRTSPSGAACRADDDFPVLTGLTPGTSYTWKTYRSATCAGTALASVEFKTPPAQVAGVSATAAAGALEVSWTAAAGATGYVVQWKSGAETYSTARQATATTNSYTIPGLTAVAHTVRVKGTVADAPDGPWSADATGTPTAPPTPTLTAGTYTTTGATLTAASHPATWYHKRTSPTTGSPSCSTAVTTTTAALTGLDSGRAYTWKSYSDSTCTTANELAEVDFTTLPAKML